MNMATTTRAVAFIIALTHLNIAFAGESAYSGDRDPAAETCFEQASLAAQGADASTLSINACEKAFHKGPHTSEHKSTIYHNRALIELAMGQPEAARKSIELAVDLASEVGPQHLTLAQLAYKQGDYELAGQIFDELLATEDAHPVIASNRELLQRNRDQIAQLVIEEAREQAPKYSGVSNLMPIIE
jgi:tetratricopeptide (TPR) repeat protein